MVAVKLKNGEIHEYENPRLYSMEGGYFFISTNDGRVERYPDNQIKSLSGVQWHPFEDWGPYKREGV